MSYTSIKKSRVTVKRFVLMVYMPRQISQFSKAKKKKDHHLWVGSSICLCVKENFGKTGMINATGVQMKLSVCSICKIAHIATSKRSFSFAAHSPRWGAGRHPVEAWSPSQVCVAGWSPPKQHPRSPTVLWSSQKGGRKALENMVEKHKLDWIVLGITPTSPPWNLYLILLFPHYAGTA